VTREPSGLAPAPIDGDYTSLLAEVSRLLEDARRSAARSVNVLLTAAYWRLGRQIVEFEQRGERRAEYGRQLLLRLAADLTVRFGRGFGYTNLNLMRQFYLTFPDRAPISETTSWESPAEILQSVTEESGTIALAPDDRRPPRGFSLSFTHYVRLLALREPHQRDFYEEEARRAGWSVRQLDRQIDSMLYERVALSRAKGELLAAAERSGVAATAEDAIKDPYVLEFLGLPEPHSERDLENALIRHLADFLLELGPAFAFVARQKRLQVGSESYYLDLLFYHRGLRCLVAIDLKVGRFSHADAGQMNLYLNYLCEHETLAGEAAPIGLILCAEKDEAVAHYALGGLTNQVFASRYQLQLPEPALLEREIAAERRRLEARPLLEGHSEG
jgi:predicted nuclease of restriction endonuclease-like (RecB) superfamily